MYRSRTRRIAKWTGLVVSVFIIALWVMSFYREIQYITAHYTVWAPRGYLLLDLYGYDLPADTIHGWCVRDANPNYRVCWLPYFFAGPDLSRLMIPFWLPLLATAIPTVWLWRRDRRHPRDHCQWCGYNLMGNVTAVCSECGGEFDRD